MKNILYTIILLLLSTNLLADATQGEMFGLKLGDQYPVNHNDLSENKKNTRGCIDSLEVQIENAAKPKNYGNISICVSMISHTIVEISSYTSFKKASDARVFTRNQTDIFEKLYDNKLININTNEGPYRDKKGEFFLYLKGKFFDGTTIESYFQTNLYSNKYQRLKQDEYNQYFLDSQDIEGL